MLSFDYSVILHMVNFLLFFKLNFLVFFLSLVGVFFFKRDLVSILISIEIILLHIILNFALIMFIFDNHRVLLSIYTLVVLVLAAVESAVVLCLIVVFNKKLGKTNIDFLDLYEDISYVYDLNSCYDSTYILYDFLDEYESFEEIT